ncbi:unnamed protein product [Linum trigynum]|uniref:Reverse transcriptase n=1 Tax=Linum trigynum TaxID=586398 RepID=A0AAV2E423_9ROSI
MRHLIPAKLILGVNRFGAALLIVKQILDRLYSQSGLRCNPQKCEVFFGGKALVYKEHALRVSGFAEGHLPVRYLGLPLIAGRLTSKECAVFVDKLTSGIRS